MRLEVKTVKGKKYLQIVDERGSIRRIHVGPINKEATWRKALTYLTDTYETSVLRRVLSLMKKYDIKPTLEAARYSPRGSKEWQDFIEKLNRLDRKVRKRIREQEKLLGVKIIDKDGYPIIEDEDISQEN